MMTELFIEKKIQKIEEKEPEKWEDNQSDGSRIVKFISGTTPLVITDSTDTSETFQLTSYSTHKREGDWVKVIGREGSIEQ